MIGEEFSHYRVDAPLGRGGMGVVYRGWDTLVDRPVALKFLRADDLETPGSRERMLREARAAMSVVHENVCPVYGVEELTDGRLCIAMAYCEGESLQERMQRQPFPWDERLRIASGIAAGLAAAHTAGVVHRDVKPSNVMLTADGAVRLVDFGVARREGTMHTESGRGIVGTPLYMAPEVLWGGQATFASDVFSLGVTLWQLLTGSHPFGSGNDPERLRRVVGEEPALAPDVRTWMPDELLDLLRRLLAKDPDARIADAREVVEPLRQQWLRYRSGSEAATEPLTDAVDRTSAPGRRSRAFAAVGIAMVIAAIVLFFASHDASRRPSDAGSLAVIAARGSSGSLVVEGLATALELQLRPARRRAAGPWVVPHQWIDEVGAWSERGAGTLLGVDRVLLIEPAVDGGIRMSAQDSAGAEIASLELGLPTTIPAMLDAARELGVPVPEAAPASGDALPDDYLRGLAYMRRGTAGGDSAVVALERAVASHGGAATRVALAEALCARARLRSSDADVRRASTLLDSLMAVDAAPVRARIARGRLALDQGDAVAGERWLREARQRGPADFQVLRYLAWAHELQDHHAIAERILLEAVERFPDFVASHERLGLYYYRRGLYREAWESFARASTIAPGYGYSFNLLGASAAEMGCWPLAVDMFERSLRRGRSFHATANLGALYYNLGRFDEAVSMYRWAAVEAPDDHETLGGLAASLWWADRREEAIDAYRRAVDLAEADVAAHGATPGLLVDLAGYYAVWDTTRARELLEQGEAALPTDVGVGFLRAAAVRTVLGDVEAALDDLRRAVALGVHPRRLEGSAFLSPLRDNPGYHHLVRSAEAPSIPCPDPPADPTS